MAMIVRGFVEPIAKELPDGVRPRAQPPDRAADGRRGRLMTAAPAPLDAPRTEQLPPTRRRRTPHERREPSASRAGEARAARAATCTRSARFDVADHPVPTGREEDWRFTPARRACAACTPTRLTRRAPRRGRRTPPTASRVERRCRREAARDLGVAGGPERPGRPRVAAEHRGGAVVDRRARPRPSSPSRSCVRLDGQRRRRPSPGTSCVRVGPLRQGHRRARPHRHRRAAPRSSRSSSATARDVTVVSVQDWADDAVHLAHHARDRWAGTPRSGTSSSPSAATSCGIDANASLRRPRRLASSCSASTSPTPASTSSTGCSSTTTAPHCRSNVVYKGALQGEGAHTVWVGDVLIRQVAEGTDTYEENRNLVLTDGARADSVPNLEIETGEIEGAGHASATGRFDDEQLFYLQVARHPRGRGPPPGRARLLRRRHPQDRRPRDRGAAAWTRRGASSRQERRMSEQLTEHELRARLRARRAARRRGRWPSTIDGRRRRRRPRRATTVFAIERHLQPRRRLAVRG